MRLGCLQLLNIPDRNEQTSLTIPLSIFAVRIDSLRRDLQLHAQVCVEDRQELQRDDIRHNCVTLYHTKLAVLGVLLLCHLLLALEYN